MRILLICVLFVMIIKSSISNCTTRQCDDLCNYNCDDNDVDCQFDANECCESCNIPCVRRCSSRCRTRTCRSNCLRTCDPRPCRNDCKENCQEPQCPPEPIRPAPIVTLPPPIDQQPIIFELPTQPVLPNITTNNLVNLTTHINLNNVVHNINNITTPIFVNTTNINKIQIINNGSRSGGIVPYPSPIVQPSPPIILNVNATNTNTDHIFINKTANNLPCCKIMGEKQCYFDENGKPKCRQHRYTVCGPMCYSPVIIQTQTRPQYPISCPNNLPYPCSPPPQLPPVQIVNPLPQIINPRPTINLPIGCYPCYSCGGNNPNQCLQSPNCPSFCRQLLQQSTSCVTNQGIQCQ